MKKTIITILALLASFCFGFFVRSHFTRFPSMEESSSIHYCSCVIDNPAAQHKLFRVANRVNELIAAETKKFASKHNVSSTDFQTILLTRENGDYKVISWCSNRSGNVSDLKSEYHAMTRKHINLYKEALIDVHDAHHSNQSITPNSKDSF